MKVSSRERILLLTTALVVVAVSLYFILEPRLKEWKALETELLLKLERLSLALKTLEEARIEGPIRRVSMCHSVASMMERLDTLTKEDGIRARSVYSVAEGSSIKGARVLRIDPNRVVLEEEDKEVPLILR